MHSSSEKNNTNPKAVHKKSIKIRAEIGKM
jgi:hypothetical protein